jgi:hypothetical protein
MSAIYAGNKHIIKKSYVMMEMILGYAMNVTIEYWRLKTHNDNMLFMQGRI